MDEILQVSVDTVDAFPVVSATGEIDVSSAPALRDKLNDIPNSEPIVVVDLSKVTFLDSTGIGVLVGALKRLQSNSANGMLRLVVQSPHILKVLEVTGLTTVFSVYPSLNEATTS